MIRKRFGPSFSRVLPWILGIVLAGIIGPYTWVRITAADRAISLSLHATPQDPLSARDHPLRIATLNIAHGRGARLGSSNWTDEDSPQRRERLTQIGQLLARYNLDIVVLNEVDFDSMWSHHLDQAAAIAQAGGFQHIVRQSNFDVYSFIVRLRFGNAVLSKFRVIRAEHRPLPPFSWIENALAGNHDSLFVELEVSKSQRLGVWAVHLEVRDEETRRRAVKTILADYPLPTLPTVLLGDLNSTMSSESSPTNLSAVDLLIASDRFNTYPAASSSEFFTFPSQEPRRTLDWIFIPKSLRFVGGEVMKNNLTDHFGVVAEIAFPK